MCHNINDWDYTTNCNVITITDYKGKNPSSLIIPNGADLTVKILVITMLQFQVALCVI